MGRGRIVFFFSSLFLQRHRCCCHDALEYRGVSLTDMSERLRLFHSGDMGHVVDRASEPIGPALSSVTASTSSSRSDTRCGRGTGPFRKKKKDSVVGRPARTNDREGGGGGGGVAALLAEGESFLTRHILERDLIPLPFRPRHFIH